MIVKVNTALIAIVSILFLLNGLPVNATPAELDLAGSTTFQKRILEPADVAIKKATGIVVAVRGINSGEGLKELVAGKIPASISSSPLSLLLKKINLPDDGTYQQHVIVKDMIVPIVHPSNPVTQLTWQQLSDINTGKIKNWKEVGGEDWKIFVVTSQPTAATRLVFQKLVMKKQPYVKGAKEVITTRMELADVAKYKGCIGAVSKGFVDMYGAKVKVVKTDEISRPLCIITKGNPNPQIQKLIDYLRTKEAQKLFK